MKKVFSLVISLFLVTAIFKSDIYVCAAAQDMKAVWMTTIFSIDFPSSKNNISAQKDEFVKKLDQIKAIGINTIVVQVRPKADALYKSAINPWSDVLTGVQGKDPGYDPMDFMIKEAHKRGIAFHAWLNPYRITTSGTYLNVLSKNSPARLHPNWVLTYNNALYYNPELEEVKKHIADTVKEIVNNYNVDAIDFDDYFYPSNYPLPKGEGKDGIVANKRRQHINDMIQRVSNVIKMSKKNIKFGVSPIGIWKNSKSDPTGSNTNGYESYYAVYGDTRCWIKNQWIDYVIPQIYWKIGTKAADYETLVKWWTNEVKGTTVKLYIGQGIYNNDVAKEIDKQLKINQNYPEVGGSFYYDMKDLLLDRAGCKAKITVFNKAITNKNISNKTAPKETVPNKTISSTTKLNNISDATSSKMKFSIKTGFVTAASLYIRNGAGTQYSIAAKVTKGTKVAILESKSGWYNVKLPSGKTGWASKDYIKVN